MSVSYLIGVKSIRYALILMIGVSLSATTAIAEDTTTPREGSVNFNGHRYLLVDEVPDLSWHGAKKECALTGGHLAVVTSAEEADFITELCDGRYMYLGATDEKEEGKWTWIDGSAWGYTAWSKGQPNNYGDAENYLATYDGGAWVDVDSEGGGFWMPTGYLCEWDD